MNKFGNRTPEQIKESLRLAHIASAKKSVDRANNIHNLKLEYLDSNYWSGLASKYGVRMPNNADKVTAGLITKYLRRIGVSRETFDNHYTNSSYFIKHNPEWSAYAFVGLLLELKEESTHGV